MMQPSEARAAIIAGSSFGSVTAFYADTGDYMWQHRLPPVWCSCVADHAVVYIAAPTHHSRDPQQQVHVTALCVRDGAVLWEVAPKGLAGYCMLSLAGDRVFTASGMGNGTVFALDVRTGAVRWKDKSSDNRLFRLIAAHGDTVFVLGNIPGFRALDAQDGKERWRYEHGPEPMRLVVSASLTFAYTYMSQGPALVTLRATDGKLEDILYLHRGRDKLLALSDQGIAYIIRGTGMDAVRIGDRAELWHVSDILPKSDDTLHSGVASMSAALTHQTIAYSNVQLAPPSLTLGAVELQTGEKLWEWRSDERLATASNAVSLAAGHGSVFAATRQGLFAFRERDGGLLWHAFPRTDFSFIRPVLSPPT